MFHVGIGGDDFCKDSKYVKLGNVAKAIARVLLAMGSPNRFQAERDAWPYIHTGIATENLHPLAPATLKLLPKDDYGTGIVLFDELVKWGRCCKRFDFVVASPAAKVEAAPVITPSNDKPWLIANPNDPEPEHPWYIPARYFARQLVKEDSTLLTKRSLLATKVVQSLTGVGIKKRGGVKPFDPDTVKKALANISLG